ncbi:MAG: hypothetical protein ACYS8I_14035 [Planctomycetota bacterium]
MAKTNAFAVNESIVQARQNQYSYRSHMGMVNSAEWVVLFDDFLQAEQATENLVGWTTILDVGATAVDGGDHGGTIDITSDTADEGMAFYGNLGIALAGKKFFMEARVKYTDADDGQWVIGLSDLTSVTNPEDLYTTQPDFIGFGTETDGSAVLNLIYDTNNGGPVTDASSASMEDDTWAVIAIEFNPDDGNIRGYKDGNLVVTSSTQASVPDDLPLAPYFAFVLEDITTDIGTIDYIRVVVER